MPEQLGLHEVARNGGRCSAPGTGRLARGPVSCRARAISSFPVPVSPVTSTLMLLAARRPMARNTSCIAGGFADHLRRPGLACPAARGMGGIRLEAGGRHTARRRRSAGGHFGGQRGGGGAAHQGGGGIDVERFWQVLESPPLVARHGGVQGRNAPVIDDDRQIRRPRAQAFEQGQAIDARHADVGQQHVRGPGRRPGRRAVPPRRETP